MKKKVILCKLDENMCPSVEFLDNGSVRIGEEPSFVTISKDQWNILVDKIEKKELSKV